MTDAELQAHYQAAVARNGSRRSAQCASPEQLQALAERTGDEEERLEILDHVMSCAGCHGDLALLQAIHSAQPRQATLASRRWLAAATLLIVLAGGTLVGRRLTKRTSDDLTRGGLSAASGGAVSIIAPLGPVAPDGLHRLTWHATPGAVRYVVEVLDSADRVIYSVQTPDTTVPVASLNATAAAWWVRATLGDGSDRRSPMIGLSKNSRR
jgi:hypothetical protein